MNNEHSVHISRNRKAVPPAGISQAVLSQPRVGILKHAADIVRFFYHLLKQTTTSACQPARSLAGILGGLFKKKVSDCPTPASHGEHVHGINGLFIIMERARVGAERTIRFFPIATAVIFCLSSLCIAFLIIAFGHLLLHDCPPLFLGLTALLPSVLLAGAIAHLAGNYLLRRFCGLDNLERRSLALHLPWNRTPSEWPAYFRRWIYCGDWLVENFSGDLLPYVRAFVTGDVPKNIEEELALWSSFMQSSRRSQEIEVGHSVRELACVDALPSWTREITPGMNLPDLEKALGNTGHEWAVSLLKRAATRKRIFGLVDITGDLHEAIFEFHYSRLSNDREGLMVVIRPHLPRNVRFMEDSFSDVA